MKPFKRILLCLTVAVSLSVTTGAASVADDLISNYFTDLESFQGAFVQTVTDVNGEVVQNAEGNVWIQRPGRFRWDYEIPYRQQIVADGEQIWTYDEDLEQATVREIDEALSSTPAMLLSSYRPLAEVMDWKQTSSEAGTTWYRLGPKQQDASIEELFIAFENSELALIRVLDGFGNQTEIRFSEGSRNQDISPERFRFTIPEGTDIIGTPK
jgi:outer membrane lipoprotein carrier protein